VWQQSGSSTSSWENTAILSGHNGFVGAVTSSSLADGSHVAITGGNDSIINLWALNSDEKTDNPIKTLIGHAGNVCCLYATNDGLLASGSWDA
jgi:WD40 repeat protein